MGVSTGACDGDQVYIETSRRLPPDGIMGSVVDHNVYQIA